MKESIVIDPRTEDAANSPLEIYREPGHGPGLYVQRDSESYPDPPQEKARVAGRDGDRPSGRPRYGNREIGVGILAINDPSIGAGTNLHPQPVPGTDATGWASGTGTVAVDATRAYVGDSSWLVTRTSAGVGDSSFYPTDAAKHFPVAPMKRYVCTYRVQAKDAAATLRQARAEVSFYVDSAGAPGAQVGSTVQGTLASEIRDEWALITVTAIAPLTAAWGRSQVRFDSVPQNEVHFVSAGMVEERLPSLKEAMQSLGSTLLLGAYPNPAAAALQDISANAYAGSLVNGATIDSTVLIPGEAGALALDGLTRYGSFAAPTRRNLCPDPSLEGTVAWVRTGQGPDGAASTTWAKFGAKSLRYAPVVTADNQDGRVTILTPLGSLTPGAAYTFSAYINLTTLATNNPILKYQFIDAGGATTGEGVVNATQATGEQRVSKVNVTAPANASRVRIEIGWQTGYGKPLMNGDAPVLYVDGCLIEQSSTLNPYLDGDGYVNASGAWVPSAGIECGWLGTAHASASDKGPLGNGKTITVVGVVQVSADAASGVGQTLLGSNQSGGVGTIIRLVNTAGTREIRVAVGGTAYTWTLTAAEIAATAAGQTFAYRLEFNETADTATLQINGLPAVTKTGVTAQHGAGQSTVYLGAYGVTASMFPGKIGQADILAGTISAAAWASYLAIAAAGGGSSTPTPAFTGDTPGCAWDTLNARTCSQRPAPDIRLDRIVGDWEAKIAKLADRGGTYRRRFESGPITFDLLGAEQTEEGDGRIYRQGLYKASARLEALAFARGVSETRTLRNETASPVLSFEELAIPGPVAAIGELVVSETSANDRRGVAAAVQVNGYDPTQTDTQNYLRAIDLTPLGGAASVADAASNSGNVIEALLSTDWVGLLSTQKSGGAHLKHAGPHKIWARIKAPSANLGTLSVRLFSAQGDLLNEVEGPVRVVPLSGSFWLADLGVVRIDREQAASEQQWRGILAAKSSVGGDKIRVDDLRVMPVGDAYVEATAPVRSLVARGFDSADSFSQSSGNLNGKTADQGGAWATAGATGDFTVDATTGRATRVTVSDADARFAVLAAAAGHQTAAADIVASAYPAGLWQGLLLRYVDTSNWLAVVRYSNSPTDNRLDVIQRLAGVTTILLEKSLTTIPVGGFHRITASVDLYGRISAGFDLAFYEVRAPAAAAGGALASGKRGLVDFNPSATASTRQWENYATSAPPPDAAIFASKSWRWRHDGVLRDDASGSGRSPMRPEGDLLYVPPSGREGRRARIVVMPSDGDLDELSDGVRRNFSAQLSLTPRYLSVRGR